MSNKYQIVADALRSHIQVGKYAAADILPSEFAIAQEYQVSRQTVRRALSILAQDGLIETRQGSGSHIVRTAPASANRHSVAVIVTYISDYVFPGILREIEDVLSQQECTFIIYATRNQIANERKILGRLLEQPVDGIIVEATKSALPNPNLDLYRKLMANGTPLVFIHGYYADLPEPHCVLDDNYEGCVMLARYLA
ncbi:MAG: GntR family transcriptional regulator, partial [Oscillospiraceae bacterium]|nr:GntR family transcriptional regulator [Oscillospiraceae bacterium]